MKKILSVVIAISMLLGMMIPMGITASAAEVTECATWAEVVAAVEADSAASIKLTADVTANSTIESFAGTFDGNGKTVTVETTMFTTAAEGSTFKNFTMNGTTTVSPFIMNAGAATEAAPITIENVTSNVDVTITTGTCASFIAMVPAVTTFIVMDNCVSNGAINSTNQVGSFIGRTNATELTATFTNCVNNSNVSTTSSYAGGFIGMLDSGKHYVTIDRCANNGTISADGSDAAGFIGDVAGNSANTVAITNSVNSGKIINNKGANDNEKYSASGFIARVDAATSVSISNCLSTATAFESTVGHAAYFCNYKKVDTTTFTLTNCYYVDANLGDLHTGALELGEGCQMTAVTAEQLASGEVAYKLGEAWGQKLDLDTDAETAPVIGGEPVYQYPDGRYSNTPWGQGGTDEPEIGESSVILEDVNDVLTATIEGPTTLNVGDTANIVVTYTITKENHLINAYGIGFTPANTDIVDFTENATFALSGHDDDFEDFTHTYGDAKYISQSVTKGRGALQVVVTFTITAKAAGSTAINFYDNPDLKLFAYTSTDLTYEQFEPLDYTITVIDENADEPIVVDTINVNGYVEPTVGASIADSLAGLSVPEGAPYSIVDAYWFNDSLGITATEETFLAGNSYSLAVNIQLADGYVFAGEYTLQFNGDASLVDFEETYEDNATDLKIWSVITELPAEGGEGGDEPIVVDTINVNGYVAPTVGASIADSLAGLSVPEGAPYSIIEAHWYNDDTFENATEETFAAGTTYCLRLELRINGNCTFADEVVCQINGGTELVNPNYTNSTTFGITYFSVSTALDAEGGDEPTGNVVTSVNVNGYVAPTVGANLADALANLSVPEGAPYSIVSAYWFNDATLEIATEETFAEGGMYCLYVRFALADGYTLDIENCAYALNGDTDLVLFGSPNYDETVDCDFLLCSKTTTLDGGEGGETTTPDGSEENPFVIQNKGDVDAILVPAGETYYFIIDPFTYYDTVGEDFIGNLIKVIGEGATINDNATLNLPTNGRVGWPVLFSITAGDEDARAEIVVPKGTFNNPDSFDAEGKAEVSLTYPKNEFEPYIFIFKADKNGILVVTAPDGTVVTINNLSSSSYGDMGVNTADVVAGDEIQILIGTDGADAAGTVSVTIVPHLNIAVWTKNGDWVTADELEAIKAGFAALLAEDGIDASKLGIEWVELTTEDNKVADLGALVNAGDFDIIVGCGNNVDSTAGVTIVEKADINSALVAAGRKAALLDAENELAVALYDYLTSIPAEKIDEIVLNGVTAPTIGGDIAASLAALSVPEGANYTFTAVWTDGIDEFTEGTFYGYYYLMVDFIPNDGYEFAENATFVFAGAESELDAEWSYVEATEAHAETIEYYLYNYITEIDVSGITAPVHGQTVAEYAASFVPVLPEGAKYSITNIAWAELDPETMMPTTDEPLADDYVFDSSKTYAFICTMQPEEGYAFDKEAVITANGGALELYESVATDDFAGVAVVFNAVPATGDNSAIAIFAIAAVATIGCIALALRKKKED